jgi:eukaryotic-like serine/threonine-protein kinase
MSSTVAPEVVLAGRYRLVRRLASGGMGQVWRASDEILGRPVAVKLLRSEYAEDPEFVDRFRAEARRTAALSHPGIASVFDYGETSDPDAQGTTAYLVMELVEGEPLSVLLAREGRLSPAHTLDLLAQSALALDSAHQAGVVHRDVKPSNLLLRRDGVAKVTDFGIAHAADEAPRTEAGLVVGTAAYLSPEQVACRPATPASDVYALGVVAYECLAGRRPFTGEHPIALALAHRRSAPPPLPDDVPDAVRQLVAWTMSKAPKARPPSAGALGRQALVTRAGLPETPEPDDPRTPASGWLPVMSGWHPALGRGQASDDADRPVAPNPGSGQGPGGNGWAKGNGKAPRAEAAPGTQGPSGRPPSERMPSGPAPPGQTPRGQTAGGQAPRGQAGSRAAGGQAGAPAAGGQAGPRAQCGRGADRRVGDDVDGLATGEWSPEALPAQGVARPRHRRRFVLAAAIMLTVLVVGGVVAAARQRSVTVVPSVDGQRITAAGQALARAGFEVRERSRPDRSVRAGVVLSQEPAGGTRLARGRLVTMVVSSGPRIVILDPARYLGRPLHTVRAAMIRLGLRVSVTGRMAWAVASRVTAINPSGSLHQGDSVTVTVATSRRGPGA